MLSYFQRRRIQGQFPLPLRYVCLGLFVFTLAVYLWPDTAPEIDVTAIQPAADASKTEAVIETAAETMPSHYAAMSLPDPKPVKTVETRGRFTPSVSEKVTAILASFAPPAGRPLEIGGVHMPEPRPVVLSINPSKDDIEDRLRFLEREGIKPHIFEVESGDTLAEALVSNLGVSYEDVQQVTGAISGHQDPKEIRPGQKLRAYTVKGKDKNILLALEIQQDVLTDLTALRVSQSRFAVAEIVEPVQRTVRAAQGRIENSLYLAADNQNVPDRIIVELIRAYSWSIDFQRDIRVNDQFEILYEEYRTKDGEIVPGMGDIVYAALVIDDMPYSMYRFERENGRVDYYEPDGQSVRKALMITPINGARLSSGFGRRKHPVLGYTKMHKGLDYAAPRGTPIYAAGDGVIEYMGRYSSFGNYVRIRHRNSLKTIYAHMKGFKSGLGKGSRVKQGDTIGYVGTTGRSTGPHLHYEVHLRGKAVNPKSIKLPTGDKLKGKELERFKNMVEDVKDTFDSLGVGKTILAML